MKNRSALFQRNRRELLSRFRQCELCGHEGKLTVHHKIPLVYGGSDDTENLIVICERCHSLLHAGTKSQLTKTGMEGLSRSEFLRKIRKKFYDHFNEILDEGGKFDVLDVFDYLDNEVWSS